MPLPRARRGVDNSASRSGGGFLNTLASLFGGGRGPDYQQADVTDTGASSGDIPQAKFIDNRNFFDRFRGQPDLASQYNAQIILNQLAGQQGVQNAIAQAKGLQPIAQQGQQFTANLNDTMRRKELLEKELAQMSSNDESLLNRALYDPTVRPGDSSSNVPNAFIPGTTRLDPAVAAKARTAQLAAPYSTEANTASQNYLNRDIARAQMIQAPVEAQAAQQARINAAKLAGSTSGLNLDILNQNRPITMQTAEVQAKGGLAGAQGELGVAGEIPRAKLEEVKSRSALERANAEFMSGAKTDMGELQRKKLEQDIAIKNNPMLPVQNMMDAMKNPKVQGEGVNAPANNLTSPGNIKSTLQPVPISQAKPGVDFKLNPDGSAITTIPILGLDGKIIPPGTLMQKKNKIQ